MYIVVSKWNISSLEEARTGRGKTIRNWLKQRPEVEFGQEFITEDGNLMAIFGYKDENSYKALILADDSPFAQKVKELQLETIGEWAWSERGHSIE